jgi:hypothetical protein
MNGIHEDRFMVFLRLDRNHASPPEEFERCLTSCPTYEEARRIQREYRTFARECVIRYEGETGGGD